MTLRAQIINRIISEIDSLPEAKLKKILDILESNDQLSEEKKAVLKFAGTWSDIDSKTFKDLTTNLKKNRDKNNRTIN